MIVAYLEGISAHCAEIHAANVAAGWWPENRNRGEVMMLIVSEIAEASYGSEQDLMDDHLPELPMYSVELADAAIRLMDLLGADKDEVEIEVYVSPATIGSLSSSMVFHTTDEKLMLVVRDVADAMEAHRKGRLLQYVTSLSRALARVFTLASDRAINLPDVIAQKRAYNAQRADHKLENRLQPGGKAY